MKSKVNSKEINTAPRSELLSCLIASRVYDTIKYELSSFFENFDMKNVKFKFIGDSQIVLSQIRKSSYLFKMWAQNKILEIQELTKGHGNVIPEFYHCKSEDNIADILTRQYTVENYLPWLYDLKDPNVTDVNEIDKIAPMSLPEIDKKNIKINNFVYICDIRIF